MCKLRSWLTGTVLIAAAVAWIYVITQFTVASQPILAGIALVIGGLALFILIILTRMERMAKGLALVGLAVLAALLNSVMVEPLISLLNTVEGKHLVAKELISLKYGGWIWEHLSMDTAQFLDASKKWINAMLSFINIACAGAGGSIIAVEGDRTSIERPVGIWRGLRIWRCKTKKVSGSASAAPANPDTTPFIQALGGKMDRQTVAVSDLVKLVSGLDKQLSTLTEQRDRNKWKLQVTALVVAVLMGFALGAVVFSHP